MSKVRIHCNKFENKVITKKLKDPIYIYIPLGVMNNKEYTLFKSIGDSVLKGELVAKTKGALRTCIHSSVSGKVIDIKKMLDYNDTELECLVIENDYLDNNNYIEIEKESLIKEKFINYLMSSGIIGLGGAGFPTYIKYMQEDQKTLLVNAVECEPFITADKALSVSKTEELLETIDYILKINNLNKAVIAVKKNNSELIELIETFIGTYIDIELKLVNDIYPMGWERTLVKEVFKKEYKKYPSELGIIVNNISTCFAISELINRGKPLVDRIISFSGDYFSAPVNVKTLTGTSLEFILEQLELKFDSNKSDIIVGGPMMGNVISNENLVITPNITSIIINKKSNLEETECMKCGKCIEVCPVNLSPVVIKEGLTRDGDIKNLRPERCIECGLCSYICPAKINIREYVRKAKKEVLNNEK